MYTLSFRLQSWLRRWWPAPAAGTAAAVLSVLWVGSALADVGATGSATVVCAGAGCCGQIQFDDQTYSVFGNDYNIVQSGVQAVGTTNTAITLAEVGTFSGSWAQIPAGSFGFGASGTFLCDDPATLCTAAPVSFVGQLASPTFPPVLTQYLWTFDGTLPYTESPVGPVPAPCVGIPGLYFEGQVAFNAFLVGAATGTGNQVSVVLPVSYFDTITGIQFHHTVRVTYEIVTQVGTTSATAFTSAPGDVLPGFQVRVNGQCSVSKSECDSTADCPSGETCFGPFNGGYIDVSTDATYFPPIQVCVTLDPLWLQLAGAVFGFDIYDIRLKHDEGGTFANGTTTSIDANTNTVCATVDSLSFFALGVATCPETPTAGCRNAAKSSLLIKDAADDAKDKLTWKWLKGDATAQSELLNPTASDDYALCVYAGAPARLIHSTVIGANPSKWAARADKGFKYADAAADSDGVISAKLSAGAQGKAKMLVKGKGATLREMTPGTLPIPSASFPVRAQLVKSGTGLCWEGSYAETDAKKNEADQFHATAELP